MNLISSILKVTKIAGLSLVASYLLLVTPVIPALAANFSDVPSDHKNALAIQTLKDANLVNGYGDSTFKPDKEVSRAEALTMILKSAGIDSVKTAQKIPFTDVAETDWFFPMVQKAITLGKVKGYEDKTFRPNKPITLPEALALTLSFFNVNIKKIPVEPVIYKGLDTKDWYAKQAQYAKDKNLIEPDENGMLSPAAPLTRGQLAEIIYRMRLVQQTAKSFDVTKGWIETEHLENFWKIKHPADWEVFKGVKNSAIWKKHPYQLLFSRVWPTSAKLTFSIIENTENLTASQYFAKLKEAYKTNYPDLKPNFSELLLSDKSALKISIPQQRLLDTAIYLPNKNFLIINGEYGQAAIGEFLKKQLELIVMSYQYVEKPPELPKPVLPLEQRMEILRENILVPDKWKDTKDLFPDKKLIFTDAIGIGTGPVDYYYSKEANHTVKLERSSGTILNIKEGEITSF